LVLAKAKMEGCLPNKKGKAYLKLRNARHPLLDAKEAVPLDFEIGHEHDAVLITGPNTGGKTVAIKTIGLAVAMAQCGIPACAEAMDLGTFSQVWADIGDEQSLQQSLSTFSGHVKNIADAVRGLAPGALVLLDEIGAGTDPAEGAALGRALLLKFQAGGAKVVASTHYGELKIFASNAKGFVNASMEFDTKTLRPTYRFQMGVPGSSQAFRIAERHGITKDVIEEALAGVRSEELDVAKMIERLEGAQKQAQGAQSEADRLASRVRQLEQEAEEKIAKAQAARERAREEAGEELEEALGQIRREAEEIFETLKPGAGQSEIEEARSRLKSLQAKGSEAASALRPKKKERKAPEQTLTKGATVRLVELNQTGTVLEAPKGGTVNVQVGPLKMRVKLTDLEFVGGPKQSSSRPRTSTSHLGKGMTASREIQIRRMLAEDALEALERFLDEAVLAGLPSVRIVHGKGEGVLRKMTRELLRKHPHVKRYGDAMPEEGGDGATVAEFK
ncbi:MAG TPA: Smr/MutS family protein, partial [Fimbriimonadaceae bacterium]|nr:Smr/MutS family protein [Fimbriimonadaceae bacterium]